MSLDHRKVDGRVLDMVACHSMLYQLIRFIQVGETHKEPQASKDWSSGAQDPQVRKFDKSQDQHKVRGRVLDMVVCHSCCSCLIKVMQPRPWVDDPWLAMAMSPSPQAASFGRLGFLA